MVTTSDLNPNKAYIKIDGVFFPMPLPEGGEANTEESELYPGGEVITSSLEGFSPSVVAGDATVVDESRIAVLSWADWSPGMGHKFTDEQDAIGGYAYGNLVTTYPNMAVLPPKQVDLGGMPSGYDESNMRWGRSGVMPNGLYGYSLHDDNRLLVWDGTTGAGAWVDHAMPGGATVIRGAAEYGGYLVITTDEGIVTTVDGVSFTARWNSSFGASGHYGPVVHDNNIYVVGALDNKLYWTNDPTTGSDWANVSTDAIALMPDESIIELFEWKNRAGTRSVHILTTHRIIGFDDDDFFTDAFVFSKYVVGDQQLISATVWDVDKAVYLSTYQVPGGLTWQLTNDAFANVDPNKQGGIPLAHRRSLGFLSAGLSKVYALGGPTSAEFYYGGGVGPTPTAVVGWIMAYTGAGWHPVAEGTGTGISAIRSCSYIPNQVIFHRWDGSRFRVYTVYVPEGGALPYDVDHRSYPEGTYYLVSAETDAGLEETDKTARYFNIRIEKQDQTPGLATGHEAELWASWNGAAFAQVGPTLTAASTFPYRIPLPGPTDATQQGIVWQRMSWMVKLRKNVGAAANVTPILRGVALAYTRSPDLYDGFQATIDLSKDRFKGLNKGLFRGHDRAYLRNKLLSLTGTKLHYTVVWGDGVTERTIPAAEIRINGRENPGSGYGVWTITGRDVSVSPS
jgi:hypothetical protein